MISNRTPLSLLLNTRSILRTQHVNTKLTQQNSESSRHTHSPRALLFTSQHLRFRSLIRSTALSCGDRECRAAIRAEEPISLAVRDCRRINIFVCILIQLNPCLSVCLSVYLHTHNHNMNDIYI